MKSVNFKDLLIYQNARKLRINAFNLSKNFPIEEKYRLTDQLIRSTRKCPANIAEGHGRFHYQENIQFCRIARASLTETIEHINCGLDCQYINEKEANSLKTEVIRLIKMINGYIKYLKKRKQQMK